MMYVAKLCRISYAEVCQALKAAGVRWITGGGSEILTNEFRERHSPLKYTADDYLNAQEEIIKAGLVPRGPWSLVSMNPLMSA